MKRFPIANAGERALPTSRASMRALSIVPDSAARSEPSAASASTGSADRPVDNQPAPNA